jgi:uncharacterized repeat protein (TIGR03803 family)
MKTQIKKLFLLPILIAALGFVLTDSAKAVTHSVIKNFTDTDGSGPQAKLTLVGNTLYGTTRNGGTSGHGTVFKVETDGSGYTVLYNFTGGSDGSAPMSSLIVSGNALYGTASLGGSGRGTVFKIVLGFFTMFTPLHSFSGGSDGQYPAEGLTLSGNMLYGTTSGGSATDFGTLFQIDTDGNNYAVLYNFTGGSDGAYPYGGLTFDGSALYGTTTVINGGNTGNGTVFKFDIGGQFFSTLYSFTGGSDGDQPYATLILSGNTLYGTTLIGGSSSSGTVFKVDIDGNNYAVLYSFAGGSDGANPYAGLTLSGNTLYGTTQQGGSSGQGAAFKIKTDGSDYAVLHNFAGGSGGFYVHGGLTLSGNTLFGTTVYGGTGYGTVYKLDMCGIETFVVAAKAQVVPTSPAGAKYNTFGVPARNDSGNVAFMATLASGPGGVSAANNAAIYAGTPGAEALMVRKDDFAPDVSGTATTGRFGSFSNPAYNNAGEIAFRGTLKLISPVNSTNNIGLWSNAGGTLHLVARRNDIAPGTGGATFYSFTSFALPDTGDVVFIAILTPGTGSPAVTTANNNGIWVYSCSQALTKVTQKGDNVVVNGSPKTLKTINFLPLVTYSTGQSRNVNNGGSKLVYNVVFTDQTTAILGANYQ